MTQVAMSDQEIVRRHRTIWVARPELHAVYEAWFLQLLRCVEGLRPIVEISMGPGFLKAYFPQLISTDIVPTMYGTSSVTLAPSSSSLAGSVPWSRRMS